jgi:hypothetical protein
VSRKLAISCIVIMFLLLIPFAIGVMAKRMLPQLLVDEPNIEITLQHYQQGWFHSTAKLHIALRDPKVYAVYQQILSAAGLSAEEHPSVILYVNLHHGPLIWKNQGWPLRIAVAQVDYQLELDPLMQAVWMFLAGQPLALRGETYITLAGDYRMAFNSPAMQLSLPFMQPPIKVAWQALHWQGVLKRTAAQQWQGTGQLMATDLHWQVDKTQMLFTQLVSQQTLLMRLQQVETTLAVQSPQVFVDQQPLGGVDLQFKTQQVTSVPEAELSLQVPITLMAQLFTWMTQLQARWQESLENGYIQADEQNYYLRLRLQNGQWEALRL